MRCGQSVADKEVTRLDMTDISAVKIVAGADSDRDQ